MSSSSSLPWLKIMDFLTEIGAAEDESGFIRLVIDRISALVPHDLHCVLGVIDREGKLCAAKTIIENEKWSNYFKERYWNITPDLSRENGIRTKVVDWRKYQDTEYGADFMTPQDIRYSLGILTIGKGSIGTLAINRSSGSRQFSDGEQQIMEILQPHLSNLYNVFTRLGPNRTNSNPLESAAKSPPLEKLTRRETEIVDLLCRGLSTPEICTLLFISQNTAYRHFNNIFAKLNISGRAQLVAKVLGPKSE